MPADVVLLGSAARPWPEPGCRCPTCAAGGPAPAPTEVLVAGVAMLAAAGRLAVGDGDELGSVRVARLPGCVAASSGGTTVLLAGPDPLTATSLQALAGARADAAVLDLRDGPAGRPDALIAAHRLARLRAAGALRPGAPAVAVGFGHDGPGPRRQRADAVAAGLLVLPDGAAVPGRDAPALEPRTLVLGPAASGKSRRAELLLAAQPDVAYVATGPAPGPDDAAWAAAVAVHRGRRPPWWTTVEPATPAEVAGLLTTPGPPVLLDSWGTWLAGAMDATGAWDDAPGSVEELEREVEAVLGAWRQAARPVVGVAEETGWGVVPATPAGRLFRSRLGRLTQALAAGSERVELVVAGRAVRLDDGTAARGWTG